MKTLKYIIISLAVLIGFTLGTSELRSKVVALFQSKPYLELSDSSPYELNIREFGWGYGMVTINSFNGDFDKLDEKVYNLLKDKTGNCRVNIEDNSEDKYGQQSTTMRYIGDINIDELNKYQDWKYWQRQGGIEALLYKHVIAPTMDSVKTDTVKTVTTPPQPIKTVDPQPSNEMLFGINDLYQTQEKPSTLASKRWVIEGTIGEVHYDLGQFDVNTSDGSVAINFYSAYMADSTAERLRAALEMGNTIKCVATRTDSTLYDLLAAKIKIAKP